ncbi:hypothetical protein CI238_01536 [Colletotrichum incanum]|uniref:DUF6594 domain-containing protein n=1 Tax=Colletotrichum incanum TaxID=1573173 RepID=A0A166SDX7_COLIC|nr:hypothetical protein CI238_01536 [Colletotrichum incanum]
MDVRMSIQCWEVLSSWAKDGDERDSTRMSLVCRLQDATKEYRCPHTSKPNGRVFRVFKGWFESEQPFIGDGSKLLKQREHEQDFIALSPSSTDSDFLIKSLQSVVGRHVSRLVTIITVLAASLVIEDAVVILYLIKNEALRLAMIAVFTSIFAASLAVMTDGRRTDIILATAACAAVLVAFVAQN